MFTKKIALWVSISLLVGAAAARAQEERAATKDPVLDALVAEALAHNTDIVETGAAAQAARQRVEPARTLPDPSLLFNYQNDGRSLSLGSREMTFLGAMFVQPLPWPGKLKLAGEEARARAEEVGESSGRARLAIEGRVRRAYYDYLLAREELGLVEERRQSWRGILDIARERYAVGLGVQQDVLRAQVEILRLDEDRAERSARMAVARAEANRAVGRSQDTAIETAARLAPHADLPDLAALLGVVRRRCPELAGAARAVEAARLRVSLAKKDFRPDFVASGGPMYRGGLDPMWQVGVGVTLPIHTGSRLRPRQAAAEEDQHAEEARAAGLQADLELRTRERFENLGAAIRIARLYSEEILPVDRLSLESAVATYRSGKVPFITVLEALNAVSTDRSRFLARLAEAEQWRIAIDEADPRSGPALAAAGSAVSAALASAASPASGMTSSMR